MLRTFAGGAAVAGGDEYVNRGDPSAWDWGTGDFIFDATWRDLDLSSIVTDSDAHTIHLRMMIKDASTGMYFQLRKNGQTNGYNASTLRTQAANIYQDGDLLIACDENQVIEYMGAAGMDDAYLCVKGWIHPAA